jgi:hypothetical protein
MALTASSVAGCHGSSSPAGPAVSSGLTLPPLPDHGGRVVSDMKVVPVFFAGDTEQANMEGFLNRLAAHTSQGMQAWFNAVQEMKALNTMTIQPSVVLNEAAPVSLSDADVRQFIRDHIFSGALPAYTDNNSIYVLYLPLSTRSTLGAFGGCADYVGYHNHMGHFLPESAPIPDGGTPSNDAGVVSDMLYSVILRCPATGWTEKDIMTSVTSHELAEAATDPDLDAWTLDLFHVLDEGEDGDMCAWQPATDPATTTDPAQYVFQRIWSNQADLNGLDPCAPQPASGDYVNAVPIPEAAIATPGGVAHFDVHLVPGVNSPKGGGTKVDAWTNVSFFQQTSNGLQPHQDILSACEISGQPCHAAGDVISYDVPIPAGLKPGFYWVDLFTLTGTLASPTEQWHSFAGIQVQP